MPPGLSNNDAADSNIIAHIGLAIRNALSLLWFIGAIM